MTKNREMMNEKEVIEHPEYANRYSVESENGEKECRLTRAEGNDFSRNTAGM